MTAAAAVQDQFAVTVVFTGDIGRLRPGIENGDADIPTGITDFATASTVANSRLM